MNAAGHVRCTRELAAILAPSPAIAGCSFADTGRRLNLKKITPVGDGLIVDDDVRLRKKTAEAVLDCEFLSGASSVLRAACAPEVQLYALIKQLADVSYDVRERNALRTDASDEGVIDVNVCDKWSIWHRHQGG